MSKEKVFIVFGALLLIQGSLAKPQTGSEPTTEPQTTEERREINENIRKIMISAFEELPDNFVPFIKAYERIFNEVLTEISATEDKNNEWEKKAIEIISNILKKLENLKDVPADKLCEARINTLFEIRKTFNEDDIFLEKELHEKYFKKYYHQNNIPELHGDANAEVFGRIERKFDQFWNSLSAEEKSKYQRFHLWYQNFKDKYSYRGKISSMENFLYKMLEMKE